MAFRVEITPQASADLDAIAEHIATGSGFAIAEKWFTGIMDDLRALRQMPARCTRAPESELLGADIRLFLHGRRNHRYKIYFAISHPAASVRILHIRHWARRPVEAPELDDRLKVVPDPSACLDEE